jgi:hypothetical protein
MAEDTEGLEDTEAEPEAEEENTEEEEQDKKEAAPADPTPPTPAAQPVAAQAANDKKLIVDDPYDFDRCQISLTVTWLPNDGDPNGRQVIVSVRNHLDAPIVRQYRDIDIALGEPFDGLLRELKEQLPQRLNEKYKRELEAKSRRTPARPAAASSPAAQAQMPAPQATLFGAQA